MSGSAGLLGPWQGIAESQSDVISMSHICNTQRERVGHGKKHSIKKHFGHSPHSTMESTGDTRRYMIDRGEVGGIGSAFALGLFGPYDSPVTERPRTR